MSKLLVLAVVALAVAVGATRVDDLRSRLPSLRAAIPDTGTGVRDETEWVTLVATADQICSEHDRVDVSSLGARKPSQVLRMIQRMIRDEEVTAASLSELEPPASYRPAFEGWLNERRKVLARFKHAVYAAEAGNRSAYGRAMQDVVRSSTYVNTYAHMRPV